MNSNEQMRYRIKASDALEMQKRQNKSKFIGEVRIDTGKKKAGKKVKDRNIRIDREGKCEETE